MKTIDAKICAMLLAFLCGMLRAGQPASGDSQAAVRGPLNHLLTASDAARIALLNNRSLQATLEEIGISRAELNQAGLMKNPRFDLSLRFPDRPPSAVDAEESVVFDFLDLLMIPMRKHVAAARMEATRLRVANEALALETDTKIAFYELQAQMRVAANEKLILETHQAALDLAQKQHAAGNITDLALLNYQAAYSQARLEASTAEAGIREKREKLDRFMGLWGGDTDWKAAGELPVVPADDFSTQHLESLAVAQRLDLAAAHSELAGVVKALGLTKTYRYIGALEFGIDTEHNPDHSNVTGPTMSVELPIFDSGRARIAKGEAQLRQAEDRFEALAIDIRSEVREARDRFTAARDAARFYRDELVPGRTKIVQQTQLEYDGMLMGLYDLLAAKRSELETSRGETEATRDYWIARTELERAVGGNLGSNPRTITATSTTKNSH